MRKLELTLIHAAREIGALALAFTIGTVALGVNETRADLLYSDIDKTFAESIISAEYVGQRLVDGVLCHQLSLESTGADWQIWIEADDTPVPRRFAIDYVHVPGEPQFLASLTEWRIDPQFEDADFAIKLPQDAKEVSVDQMTQ